MKTPPYNTHPTAIALRQAATAWGKNISQPVEDGDPHDKAGQRLNRALLAAAIAYARVVSDDALDDRDEERGVT